jgi:four helix bundle protein
LRNIEILITFGWVKKFKAMFENSDLLKERTKKFALRVIKLYQALPKDKVSQVIGHQLLRSATSVAANYRAVCRARSPAERYSKFCIVVEESDETMFWMGMLIEAQIVSAQKLAELMAESEEILKIMAVSRKNAKPRKE